MGSVISGITMTCFAASYSVAWALELIGLLTRSAVRRYLATGFVLAGLLAQSLYLGYRVVEFSASPLSSSFDWCLVAAWLLVVAYLYLAYYYPKAALGLYMLPLVLALVAAASMADRTPFEAAAASQVWGAIHGGSLLAGTLAVTVGFVAGVLYLAQARRLKRKVAITSGIRLPSLEWLAKINGRVIILSTLLIGTGFLSGIILRMLGRTSGDVLPWTDPVVGSLTAMLVWLIAASIFNATYQPARRGRKVAYLTVVSFIFLIIALWTFLSVETQHGGQRQRGSAAAAPRATATLLAQMMRREAQS